MKRRLSADRTTVPVCKNITINDGEQQVTDQIMCNSFQRRLPPRYTKHRAYPKKGSLSIVGVKKNKKE